MRPQTLNDFAYVINNPTTWVDPTGWSPQPSIAGMASTGLRPRDSVTAELLSGLAGRSPSSQQPLAPLCKPQSSNPADEERCTELLRLIEEAVRVLKKRYFDIREDRLNLPLTGPMSVEGHREQCEGRQRRLQRFLQEWDMSKCGPPPPGAWHWASVPAPWPAPKDTNQSPYQLAPPEEAAKKGLVVTLTGVVVYVVWNLKGCIFGPAGCVVDLLTPGF